MDAKGLVAAVEQVAAAIAVDDGPAPRPVQLALIPTEAGADELAEIRKGRGRPAGSANRATKDWAAFILSNYPDPRIFLAETYARPTVDLARDLGCLKVEAFEIQRKCAEGLLPYVAKRMPIDINNNGAPMVVINLHDGVQQMQEIQGVAEIIGPPSETDQSDDARQGVDTQGETPSGGDNGE